MTDNVSYALLHGVGNVLIASVIGYVLYRLIKTKNSPIKASDYGRNWMAWMACCPVDKSDPSATSPAA